VAHPPHGRPARAARHGKTGADSDESSSDQETGNDTLDATQSAPGAPADTVRCSTGTDVAIANAIDVLDALELPPRPERTRLREVGP